MNDLVDALGTVNAEARAVGRAGFTRGRILLVDDNLRLLEVIEGGLVRAGFEVTKAADGIDALSCMYASRPDAILVDLAMPRMSGLELIAQICAEGSFRDVTVLAMSGHEGMLQRATEAGASAAIVKPFSIRGIVGALLRHRRLRPRSGA